MKTDQRGMTRRQFIHDASVAAVGGSLLLSSGRTVLADTKKSVKSDVVLVRNKDVLNSDGAPEADLVLEMLDQAVARLTNSSDGNST